MNNGGDQFRVSSELADEVSNVQMLPDPRVYEIGKSTDRNVVYRDVHHYRRPSGSVASSNFTVFHMNML